MTETDPNRCIALSTDRETAALPAPAAASGGTRRARS
jgi:hypothetical protein